MNKANPFGTFDWVRVSEVFNYKGWKCIAIDMKGLHGDYGLDKFLVNIGLDWDRFTIQTKVQIIPTGTKPEFKVRERKLK